ncbi:hypothetical protein, partial [Salmonella enterica]|uniref:hypothetical protein n=1 Tax=Salmonella enterica TaxID=28901 RepID=UPI003296DE49
MTKTTKKELLASAPWRVGEDSEREKFKDGKIKVATKSDGSSTMYVPGKNNIKNNSLVEDDESLSEIDPQLRYSFQRNFQFIQ